ncbi:hypothetical protein [Vibrio phage Artemius]|nr:hypothetical protein [Vibrio phage Artemius]
MYLAKFNLKISEIDNFENGCDPFKSETQFINDLTFESDSLTSLMTKICKHFNVRMDSVLLNSCDEIGRIDVQTYTKTLKGNKCTYDKYCEGFKNGEFDMWLNCFIGEITTKPQRVDLLNNGEFTI